MRKEIQSYGNSNVIVLTKSDMKVYGLNKGDILDITITQVIPNNTSDCFASSQPSNKSKKKYPTKQKGVNKNGNKRNKLV